MNNNIKNYKKINDNFKKDYLYITGKNDISNIKYLNETEYNKLKEYNKLLNYDYYSTLTSSQQSTIIKSYAIKVLAPLKSHSNVSSSSSSQSVSATKKDTELVIKDDKVRLIKRIFDFSNCNKELLDKSLDIIDLFEKCEMDLSSFLFYGVNTKRYKNTWGTTLIKLLKLDKIDSISKIWLYYKNYYFKPKNSHYSVKSFLDFITKYVEYPNLLKNIMSSYSDIPVDVRDSLDYLFNSDVFSNKESSEDYYIPKILRNDINTDDYKVDKNEINTLNDLRNAQSKIDDDIFKNFLLRKSSLGFKIAQDLFMKELFFLNSSNAISDILLKYGNSEKLKLLQFNNRKNVEMVELIENMLVITSFIESLNNEEVFDKVFEKLYSDRNYLNVIRRMIFKYQQMMVRLYELESNYNLTDVKATIEFGKINGKNIGTVLGSYSKKVNVLDLTNCKYTLYAHVVSDYENIKDLVEGKDGENKVFISLSPISHRNQVYYRKPTNKIILAYDYIPEGSYILGSETNVSSNYVIRDHSVDFDKDISYKQKGILETSMAPNGNNAETVVLRSGLKPCGIIIPKGMNVTPEIIRYSLLYDLPLIFTQKQETKIENPKDIELSGIFDNDKRENIEDISSYLNNVKGIQLNDEKKSNRIGVITDLHGMYEPTLAVLEDMRSKGITEIYSLGDNIGFGPNPHEVLELLRKYNVTSIYGNHEIYAVDGMDALSEHMATLSPYTVEQDKNRTAWTRKQLTQEDIDDIMKYDSKIVIERGGKKITLVHSRKEDIYENEGHFVKPTIDPSSIIIEGHEHFEHNDNGAITLRAAGMGFNYNDYGTARYLIIEEDGSFNKVLVPYNITNLKESINESGMGEDVRSTIDRFVR